MGGVLVITRLCTAAVLPSRRLCYWGRRTVRFRVQSGQRSVGAHFSLCMSIAVTGENESPFRNVEV